MYISVKSECDQTADVFNQTHNKFIHFELIFPFSIKWLFYSLGFEACSEQERKLRGCCCCLGEFKVGWLTLTRFRSNEVLTLN